MYVLRLKLDTIKDELTRLIEMFYLRFGDIVVFVLAEVVNDEVGNFTVLLVRQSKLLLGNSVGLAISLKTNNMVSETLT